MLTVQGDEQPIFVRDLRTVTKTLQVLRVAHRLDDTAFATGSTQTLWVTDPAHTSIDAVTGPFTSGEAVSKVCSSVPRAPCPRRRSRSATNNNTVTAGVNFSTEEAARWRGWTPSGTITGR